MVRRAQHFWHLSICHSGREATYSATQTVTGVTGDVKKIMTTAIPLHIFMNKHCVYAFPRNFLRHLEERSKWFPQNLSWCWSVLQYKTSVPPSSTSAIVSPVQTVRWHYSYKYEYHGETADNYLTWSNRDRPNVHVHTPSGWFCMLVNFAAVTRNFLIVCLSVCLPFCVFAILLPKLSNAYWQKKLSYRRDNAHLRHNIYTAKNRRPGLHFFADSVTELPLVLHFLYYVVT